MDLSTPILAAIVGSVVAGVISFVVNLFSLYGQYLIMRKNNKIINVTQWENESFSLIRELQREAMRMEIDDEGVEELRPTIEDIQSQRYKIPDTYRGTNIEKILEEIEWWLQEYDQESEILVSKLRGEILKSTEDFLEELESSQSNTRFTQFLF